MRHGRERRREQRPVRSRTAPASGPAPSVRAANRTARAKTCSAPVVVVDAVGAALAQTIEAAVRGVEVGRRGGAQAFDEVAEFGDVKGLVVLHDATVRPVAPAFQFSAAVGWLSAVRNRRRRRFRVWVDAVPTLDRPDESAGRAAIHGGDDADRSAADRSADLGHRGQA